MINQPDLLAVIAALILAAICYFIGLIHGRQYRKQFDIDQLKALRYDDGDGQHAEWYSGIDSAILVLQSDYYKSEDCN